MSNFYFLGGDVFVSKEIRKQVNLAQQCIERVSVIIDKIGKTIIIIKKIFLHSWNYIKFKIFLLILNSNSNGIMYQPHKKQLLLFKVLWY